MTQAAVSPLVAGQERELRGALEALVAIRFAPMQAIVGVGALTAAGLTAVLGQPRRGLTEAQLAAMAGVAPLEASTAGGVRHRLNRHLNRLLHVIVLIQARVYPPAQASLARRQQAGRTAREARRALKRHLARRVWRQW